MGNLVLGKMLFKLLAGVAKATPKVVRAAMAVSSAVSEQIEKLQPKISEAMARPVKRQELKKIYQEQKQKVAQYPEVATHAPYVLCQTTVLGNFLSEKDWREMATHQLSEAQLLERIEASYDNELHNRLGRAAVRAGFVNIRQQMTGGERQYVSFSDGQGHGVRIAIKHQEDTEVGIDLIGYQGGECHSKREEIIQALSEEGLELEQQQIIDHGDPEGYQAVKRTSDQAARQRRYVSLQRQGQVGGKK